jgi:hypothetical protein
MSLERFWKAGSGAGSWSKFGKGVQNLATNVRHDRTDPMVTGALTARSGKRVEWGMLVRVPRLALVMATLVCAIPAQAEEMRVSDARQFIAGKHFSYNCFDGTNGNGRIYADGSVAGYIQPGGSGPRRYVVLPTGTLRPNGDRYCASLRGIPFEPCFNIDRTSQVSFRGSISGLGFAYCNFTKRSSRGDLHPSPYRLRGVRASVQED